MNQDIYLSVVAPMYNEADLIAVFIERTLKILNEHFSNFELVLVDDGSTDETFAISRDYARKNPCLRVIAFSRNYGHEIALSAAIEHAAGDFVIQMDADLQHPPELIPELVEKALEGYDIVYAARKNRKGEPWFKKTTSRLFYKIARRMTNLDLPNDSGNFRIINRKVVNSIKQLRENNRHVLMLYAYVGYKTTSIPFDVDPRYAGKSKYNYHKLVNLAMDSIISFSHRPLRYMSIMSVMISVILLCYAGFILLQKLFAHQHLADGVASLIFVISGLFSVLFLFLAVISEYIGRILIESKNRPLYYVREEYRSKE